jgi:hypothetical protein
MPTECVTQQVEEMVTVTRSVTETVIGPDGKPMTMKRQFLETVPKSSLSEAVPVYTKEVELAKQKAEIGAIKAALDAKGSKAVQQSHTQDIEKLKETKQDKPTAGGGK